VLGDLRDRVADYYYIDGKNDPNIPPVDGSGLRWRICGGGSAYKVGRFPVPLVRGGSASSPPPTFDTTEASGSGGVEDAGASSLPRRAGSSARQEDRLLLRLSLSLSQSSKSELSSPEPPAAPDKPACSAPPAGRGPHAAREAPSAREAWGSDNATRLSDDGPSALDWNDGDWNDGAQAVSSRFAAAVSKACRTRTASPSPPASPRARMPSCSPFSLADVPLARPLQEEMRTQEEMCAQEELRAPSPGSKRLGTDEAARKAKRPKPPAGASEPAQCAQKGKGAPALSAAAVLLGAAGGGGGCDDVDVAAERSKVKTSCALDNQPGEAPMLSAREQLRLHVNQNLAMQQQEAKMGGANDKGPASEGGPSRWSAPPRLERGPLGKGRQSTFEGEVVAKLRLWCGEPSAWNAKKRVISLFKASPVWASWVREGHDGPRLGRLIIRLKLKHLQAGLNHGADAGMGRSAFVARTDKGSVEGQHMLSEDGLVKEPRGKSRRYLCISFLICVCARAFVYVQRVVCCYLCARTQTQTHTCMHREVKNALVEASKQGLVKIVSDDGSLARTPGIITRYRAHTQTLLGLICHTLTVKFDVSLCVLRERVHTNHTKKRTQTNKQVSRLELKCNLPSVPLHPPPPLFLQSW